MGTTSRLFMYELRKEGKVDRDEVIETIEKFFVRRSTVVQIHPFSDWGTENEVEVLLTVAGRNKRTRYSIRTFNTLHVLLGKYLEECGYIINSTFTDVKYLGK